MRNFNTTVVAVFLYGTEMWRATVTDKTKLDAFHRKCMRKIPTAVSGQTKSQTRNDAKMGWIGQVLQRDGNAQHRQDCTDLGTRREKKTAQTTNNLEEVREERAGRDGIIVVEGRD